MMGASLSGPFFYSIASLSFVVLLLSWSLESGIIYYGSSQGNNIASITKFILPWMLLQALLCMLILKFFPLQIDYNVAFIYVISNLAILYFTALYSAQKWFISLNIIVVFINVLLTALLFYCYLNSSTITNLNIHPANWYIYSLAVQALVLVIFFLLKNKTVTKEKDAALVKKIFQYSSIAFISNLLFFLVTRVDYFFVQKFCSTEALSNYIQVSKFGQLLLFLPSMIAIVIFPYTSGNEEDNYLDKVKFFCRVIVGCFIPIIVVTVLTGYKIFPWLFGNDFSAMYGAMLFYLAGFFSLSIVTVLASYLAGKAMLSANLKATVLALILVITGDVFFIPRWGINAAATVSSVAYFACMLYLLWVFKSVLGSTLSDFFLISNSDIRLLLNFFTIKKSTGEDHQ
jgi:O-antigen/teichoic acid export membrane protein